MSAISLGLFQRTKEYFYGLLDSISHSIQRMSITINITLSDLSDHQVRSRNNFLISEIIPIMF